MLTPAFHFRILEDFLDVFNEQGIILADKLKGRSKVGEKFDITKDVTSCTMDIICGEGRTASVEVPFRCLEDSPPKYP